MSARVITLSFDADDETADWFTGLLEHLLLGTATDDMWEAYRAGPLALSGQAFSWERPVGSA